MADVARAAGVSQQTVSRVANGLPNVNEQTRQRVQAAMQELGFRPSYAGRSLRDGRYHSVGLCVNDVTCLLYTSPSPRDRQKSRMPSSA